jgi:PAS domain-containing protein
MLNSIQRGSNLAVIFEPVQGYRSWAARQSEGVKYVETHHEKGKARRDGGAVDAETALLASVVDSSDDAIVAKTPEGVITSWNRGAEIMYGYPADEAIRKPISIVTHSSVPRNLV